MLRTWRRMHVRLKLAFGFFLIILAASVTYHVAWLRSPDSFIIEEQVNLSPFASIEEFLWSEAYTAAPEWSGALTEDAARWSILSAEAEQLRTREAALMADAQRLDAEIAMASKRVEDHRVARIEDFRRREVEPLEQQRSAIMATVQLLEARLPQSDTQYDPVRVAVAEIRVQLAQKNLEIAQKKALVSERIVNDYGQFALPEDVAQWRALDEQVSTVVDGLTAVRSQRSDVRQRAFDLQREMRSKRLRRLRFLDFLYFSFGVSTTTTFGDIIPNRTFTRTIVTCQMLVSIVVVGLFVNSLSSHLIDTPTQRTTS